MIRSKRLRNFLSSAAIVVVGGTSMASDRETRVSRNLLLQNLLNEKGLQKQPELQVLERAALTASTERIRLKLSASDAVPSFQVYVKSPKNTSGLKKAVLIIPGMASQVENLVGIAPAMDQAILVAIDFYIPWTTSPQGFIEKVIPLPMQIALALAWLKVTYGVPISVVSVSLGTFLHPMAIGLFQRWRGEVESHVFAFGGADFVEIAKSLKQPEETVASLRTHSALTQFIDPRFFLPILRGRSLFLEASEDEIFSLASRTSYFQDLPQPKIRNTLPGGHISQNAPWAVFTALQSIFSFLELAPEK